MILTEYIEEKGIMVETREQSGFSLTMPTFCFSLNFYFLLTSTQPLLALYSIKLVQPSAVNRATPTENNGKLTHGGDKGGHQCFIKMHMICEFCIKVFRIL